MPVCRHSEADLAMQAISLGRPEDWEQGVGRTKKDGPEWLSALHGWDQEKEMKATTTIHSGRWEFSRRQLSPYHHAMQKMGILKARICNLGQWRQSHHLSSMRPNQSRFNSYKKLATKNRKKSCASLTQWKKNTTTRLQDAWQRKTSRRTKKQTSGSILQKRKRKSSAHLCSSIAAIACSVL